MPGFITHYLFGATTYRKLGRIPLKRLIQKRRGAYCLGLQGPDVFFYFLPSYAVHKNNIGAVAHTEQTAKFLKHLLNSTNIFSGQNEQEIAKAYIAGFLGHYTLDCFCHPYVYWKSDFTEKSGRYHGQHMGLETEIDRELLMFFKRRLPSSFRQNETIRLTRAEIRTIASILHYVYTKTYPELGIHWITIYAAIRSIQFGTRFLHDPSGRKKAVWEGLERRMLGYPLLSALIPSDTQAIRQDPLNLKRQTWQNPWDPSLTSAESFLNLMKRAQTDYLEILLCLDEQFASAPQSLAKQGLTKTLQKKLGNKSYHSGLDSRIPS